MISDDKGLVTNLVELRRKAMVMARWYSRQNREGVSEERDKPRVAEISLIEGLVRQKAKEVTGTDEISEAIWQPCQRFALNFATPWLNLSKQPDTTTADAQENYEYGESKYFEGVSLWVDHTVDYVNCLCANVIAPSQIAEKTIILFLASNPIDSDGLRLDEELREIREELERSLFRNDFHLEPRGAVRPKDLVRAMLDLKPKLVHFSGHGGKSGSICMENEDGSTVELEPAAVSRLFAAIVSPIDCVFLNACYSERQARVIPATIPYVIGMTKDIGDEAAIFLATGFYRALGAGLTVPEAFHLGVAEITLHSDGEGLTPVLIPAQERARNLQSDTE